MRLWRTGLAASSLLLACAFAACGKDLPPDEHPDGEAPDGTTTSPDGSADDASIDAGVDAAPLDAAWCKRDSLGKCLPETLLDGIGPTYALTVSDGYVYYASFSKGQIWRTPVDGGTTKTLGAVSSPLGIALDPSNVYVAAFVGQPSLGKTSRDVGGTVTDIDPTLSSCRALALDGASIYTLCGNNVDVTVVRRGPGGNLAYGETTSYGDSFPHRGAIMVDATHVYWTTPQLLRRADKNLANATTIASLAFSGQEFVALAQNATTIFARTTSTVRSFSKANADGGLGEELFKADSTDKRTGLVVTGDTIDVVEPNLNDVQRMGLDGGQPKVIVSDFAGPLAIALDGSWIYWTTSTGALRRLLVE